MAKYTDNDVDVKRLRESDNDDYVNYKYFLLKYDVDENRQINNGADAIKGMLNPFDMINTFKNPKRAGILLTTIAIMLLIIFFVLFVFVPWVVFRSKGWYIKQELLLIAFPVGFGLFFMMLLLHMMAMNIFKEIKKGYALLPKGNKGQDKSPTYKLV